jgi:hypothetical protein
VGFAWFYRQVLHLQGEWPLTTETRQLINF